MLSHAPPLKRLSTHPRDSQHTPIWLKADTPTTGHPPKRKTSGSQKPAFCLHAFGSFSYGCYHCPSSASPSRRQPLPPAPAALSAERSEAIRGPAGSARREPNPRPAPVNNYKVRLGARERRSHFPKSNRLPPTMPGPAPGAAGALPRRQRGAVTHRQRGRGGSGALGAAPGAQPPPGLEIGRAHV